MRAIPPPYYKRVNYNRKHQPVPYIFTCEHASDYFGPTPIEPENESLLGTHWALDLGAAELTTTLARLSHSVGIMSTYSRLLLDPNRSLDSNTLFVEHIEGTPVYCNYALSQGEKERRIEGLHSGFHQGISDALCEHAANDPCTLVSIHSFTPVWNGQARPVEIGVLFDRFFDESNRTVRRLREHGFDARPNEPYSGMTGELMYSATHHGTLHRTPYIEFEVRQDLLTTSTNVNRIATALLDALKLFTPTRPGKLGR
ncbi:MAG: N-formylglutamate amidohydrolase [Bradymonadia bacterium]